MRKVLLLPALAAALVAVLVGAGPAQAAGPYKITAHSSGFPPVGLAFDAADCSSTVLSSPLNGLDARIVNVSAFAGRTVTIKWDTPHDVIWPGFGVSGGTEGWTSGCQKLTTPAGNWSMISDSYRITLPSNIKWLMVKGFVGVDVTFWIV